MSAADVYREWQRVRYQLEEWTRAHALHTDALAEALATTGSAYDESRVREEREAIARAARQMALLRERGTALERQRPTDDAVRRAEAQAAPLRDVVARAEMGYRTTWPQFVRLLVQTETVARTLLAASHDARLARAQLQHLIREFALEGRIPDPPAAPTDAALAHWLALVLAAVAAGEEPSDTIEIYLRSVREAAPA